MNKIDIAVDTGTTIPLSNLIEFQGNLKELDGANLEKLKTRIVDLGFTVPFFVWDDGGVYRILDGHQRKVALMSLVAEGWEVPELPVVVIPAKSESHAKEILLTVTSQYGEFNVDVLQQWCEDLDDSIAQTLRFVAEEITMDLDLDLGFAEEEPEAEKIKSTTCPDCGYQW